MPMPCPDILEPLRRTGLIAPAAGLAAVGGSVAVMAAVAALSPEAVAVVPDLGACNPLRGDFGCGHGWGCACHLVRAGAPGPG